MVYTYVVEKLDNGIKVCYCTRDVIMSRFSDWANRRRLMDFNYFQSFCQEGRVLENDLKLFAGDNVVFIEGDGWYRNENLE